MEIVKYKKIIKRAELMGLITQDDDYESILMDIASADLQFHLKLEAWFDADKYNFIHDFCGIQNNIVRDKFPAIDFNGFLPRFAGA